MANVHGKPGHGAKNQAITVATNRILQQTPNSKTRNTAKTKRTLTATRKILLATFTIFIIAGLITSEWPFAFFSALLSLITWVTAPKQHSRRKDTTDPEKNRITSQLHTSYQNLKKGGEIKNSPFEGNEISWVLGALAEERTAEKLQTRLNDTYTIINDINLINQHGKTNANIDHLVLTQTGAIMVDTKVWARPLEFSTRNGDTWLGKDTNPKTWFSVSTCLYEASQLPTTPRAIIFSVAGKAGKALDTRSEPVQITHYLEKYDHTSDLKPCKIPVFFTSQTNLIGTIKWVERSEIPKAQTLTAEELSQAKNIRF